MKKVLIATTNSGKFREIMEVLHTLPCDFVQPHQLQLNCAVNEDGATHEENALKKAEHFYRQCGLTTVAEDSGIAVDALKGELGVKTRRWGAGENATDEEWIKYFLRTMKSVPDDRRTARFICCSVAMDKEGMPHYFRGETEGIITKELEAPIYKGLPLSSCFRPTGFDKVYAALTVEQKNLISHRGKAMHAVRDFLTSLVGR